MPFRAAVVPTKQARVEVREIESYSLSPNEVLIENYAAASNPVDWKLQKYGFWFDKEYPLVLGTDVSGKISAIGNNISQYKVGDRVAAILTYLSNPKPQYGAFQEYSVTGEESITRIPDNVSYAEAATLPLAFTSAVVSLYLDMKLERPSATTKGKLNNVLLVWGASSSVGLYAVQLAVQSGYKVIATASKHNHSLVTEAGANFVVDQSAPDVIAQLKQAAGKEIKYVYDAIGTDETTTKCVEVIDPAGTFGTVMLSPANIPATITTKSLFATHFYKPENKAFADYYFKEFLPTALANGVIKANKVEIVPGWIDGTQAMLDLHVKGVSGKKLVIVRP